MFGARRQATAQVFKFAKRRFGGEVHHSTAHPPRMEFNEWKATMDKLKQVGLPAQEKNALEARLTQARLGEFDLAFFEKRLEIQKMSDVEFAAFRHDIVNSRWARDHPLLTKHHEECIMADRHNLPRPD